VVITTLPDIFNQLIPLANYEFAMQMFVITDLAIGIRGRAGNEWVAGKNLISFRLGTGAAAIDNVWVASIQIDDLMAQS